jgi:hypothetical protein
MPSFSRSPDSENLRLGRFSSRRSRIAEQKLDIVFESLLTVRSLGEFFGNLYHLMPTIINGVCALDEGSLISSNPLAGARRLLFEPLFIVAGNLTG